jgi:hypothetical protein
LGLLAAFLATGFAFAGLELLANLLVPADLWTFFYASFILLIIII